MLVVLIFVQTIFQRETKDVTLKGWILIFLDKKAWYLWCPKDRAYRCTNLTLQSA